MDDVEIDMSQVKKAIFAKAGLFGLFVLIVVVIGLTFVAIGQIDAGHEGVIYDSGHGVLTESLDEGIYVIKPFWQTVQEVEIRTQKKEVDADASSKDLQMVHSTIALNFHPTKGEVPLLYKKVGMEYEARVIAPAVQEAVKAIFAKYTAEELITKRAQVSFEIKGLLTEKLNLNYITVEEFSIVNFEFSPAFTAAIEAKQEAEQLALKAENDLKRIQIEKDQIIATAQGDAEAIRIRGEALKENPHLVQLEWVNKWDGKVPFMMMGGDQGPVMMVNVPTPTSATAS